MIEYICDAHPQTKDATPLTTIVDRKWGWCPGGAAAKHNWRRIDPTLIEVVQAHTVESASGADKAVDDSGHR